MTLRCRGEGRLICLLPFSAACLRRGGGGGGGGGWIYCRPARRALGLDGRDGSMLIIDVDCGGERQTLGPVERESLEVFGLCRPYSLPRSSNQIGEQAGEAQCRKGAGAGKLSFSPPGLLGR
jgi:hypothetical protein